MKKLLNFSLLIFVLVLSACNNEAESSEEQKAQETEDNKTSEESKNDSAANMFNSSEIEEGYWINENGVKSEKEKMVISAPMKYNPESKYIANKTLYVSYYSGEKFIKTILHDEKTPIELELVEEADNIRVSFDEKKLEDFKLTVK
ncbi:hypothetical protein [Salinicoccus sp. HZC-1]|uniref:hypothetical protein n=1 Tax=Salinicoccus sp. HZC-1 TaxID=3385497 RepID=UPI00398B4114